MPSIGSITSAIRELAQGGNSQTGPDPRAAWVFSSTKRDLGRQRFANRVGALSGTFTSAFEGIQSRAFSILPVRQQQLILGAQASGLEARIHSAQGEIDRPIALLLNPTKIDYELPKRFSRKDTMSGTCFYFFSDRDGRNTDIGTLKIAGTTGDIQLHDKTGLELKSAQSLFLQFHDLKSITEEEPYLDTGPNEFSIQIQSQVYPAVVTFYGFYPKAMSFSESADTPYSADWNIDFTVTRTVPRLEELRKYVNTSITRYTQVV